MHAHDARTGAADAPPPSARRRSGLHYHQQHGRHRLTGGPTGGSDDEQTDDFAPKGSPRWCSNISGFVAAPAILRAQAAPISVGFVTGQTGPGASIGIPYSRGIAAAMAYLDTIEGHKIRLVQIDDGGDPSASTRNARKLVEEEKVDLLIGTSGVPGTVAMAAVAAEQKVPFDSHLAAAADRGQG